MHAMYRLSSIKSNLLNLILWILWIHMLFSIFNIYFWAWTSKPRSLCCVYLCSYFLKGFLNICIVLHIIYSNWWQWHHHFFHEIQKELIYDSSLIFKPVFDCHYLAHVKLNTPIIFSSLGSSQIHCIPISTEANCYRWYFDNNKQYLFIYLNTIHISVNTNFQYI